MNLSAYDFCLSQSIISAESVYNWVSDNLKSGSSCLLTNLATLAAIVNACSSSLGMVEFLSEILAGFTSDFANIREQFTVSRFAFLSA